jgi:hypothetical protein
MELVLTICWNGSFFAIAQISLRRLVQYGVLYERRSPLGGQEKEQISSYEKLLHFRLSLGRATP